MDPKTTPLSPEKKEETASLLVQTIVNAYEKGDMAYVDMKNSSSYILNELNSIATQEEMNNLLQRLATKWPVFKTMHVVSSTGEREEKEKEVIDKLSAYISSLSTKS